MNIDRKIQYICSYSALLLLLFSLFIPVINSAWLGALIMAVLAFLFTVFVKKRTIYNYVKKQILYLMLAIAGIYVVFYYMSALIFGFTRVTAPLSFGPFFEKVLPIAITVAASEIFRAIAIAQNSRQTIVISYIVCVLSEVLTLSTIPGIDNFNIFMDVLAMTFLPAVMSNLLYHYLSKRYGPYPNIAYRLIVGLFIYIIPLASAVPDAFYSIFKLLVPIPIYLFIDYLYEKKRRYALGKKGVASLIISAVTLVFCTSIIMLISCQFRFCLIVVASPSMTGEINKGDAIIYEEYTGGGALPDEIIVFEKNNSTTIHRVVEVEVIDNQRRYTTKGDANEGEDPGYITDSNIIGRVRAKLPMVGYPTLWLRSLFNN